MSAFDASSPLIKDLVLAGPEPMSNRASGEITAVVSDDLDAVEATWRRLQAGGVESPGQTFDFIRNWVHQRGIARRDQCYVVGLVDNEPVALLPLHRRRIGGLTVLTWFPGPHVGCYAPVSNYGRLAALDPISRSLLWQSMFSRLEGVDVVSLRAIPTTVGGHEGLFDQLGTALALDTLYRAEFSSWEDCDRLQRSRSRRKHDRQQGDRLAALGQVGFEEVRSGGDTTCAIETMFRHRSARFKALGIRDPFVQDRLIGFYHDMARAGSGVDVRLHVLRLDGAIVAVRYNVVHNDRMFCLISSMSDDPAIQQGSPGKQCLLRVMQTVFDQDISVFDMGSGFTDEKRHWCNVQLPLRRHYVGLTPQGALLVRAHGAFQRTRAAAKANPQLKAALRGLRQMVGRLTGRRQPSAPEPSE